MKRPTLTIGVRAGMPPLYALKGWEELDCYARLNHPLWHAVRERCRAEGFAEGDSLKMLCAALLEESENQRAMIARYVAEVGTVPAVVSDAFVRRERCEDCKHWSRNHRLSEFGRCALCVANPHMEPDSAHSSKGEWDYCPEFSPNTELTGAERPV